MLPPAYRIVASAIRRSPVPRGKLAESLAGSRNAAVRWLEWASLERTDGPLVWVHAASVGEALTADPVVARLRTALPGLQVVLSYTSPSAAGWPAPFNVDRADYLPLDEPESTRNTLAAVRPSLIACARGDLWPEWAHAAATRRVPLAIFGGTVRPASPRLRWPVRRLLETTYRCVTWLGAISDQDADRWVQLGVPAASVVVTGDPRHDQVLERSTQLGMVHPLVDWAAGSVALVAGSTDARDEGVILAAFKSVSHTSKAARLILVPHEVAGAAIERTVDTARRLGVVAEPWQGGPAPGEVHCLIVKSMGILADVYAVAGIAYVGGGFRPAGPHAVAEPAAFAVPIVVGPRYCASRDAGLLVDVGGAVSLPARGAGQALTKRWLEWAKNEAGRAEAGLRARGALQQGAARATAEQLLRLLR